LIQFPDDISSLLHLSELRIDNNKLNQFSSQLPPNLVSLYLWSKFNHFNFFHNTLFIDTTWKIESLLESNFITSYTNWSSHFTSTFVIKSGNKNMNRQWNVNFDKWDDKNIDTLNTISHFLSLSFILDSFQLLLIIDFIV
jgi:hypothetical protein